MIQEGNNHQYYFPLEIREQSGAIQASLGKTGQARAEIVARAKEAQRIILVGSGDCYFIGYAAANAFEQLAQIPVRIAESYDFYTNPNLCDDKTLWIGFSSSGKSLYTVQSEKLAKSKGALTVGVTNHPDSQLAKQADFSLPTFAEVSYTFPTKTTTSALALLIALAADLGKARGSLSEEQYQRAWNELCEAVPASIQQRIDHAMDGIHTAAVGLFGCRQLLFVGSGSYRSTAMIGAAKIIETSRRHITACNAEEYLHLVGFSVREVDGVVIAANQSGNDRERLVADYARKQGARVIVVGGNLDSAIWPEGCILIDTCSQAHSSWNDALVSMVTCHSIANEVSALGEKNPDIPDGVDVKYVIDLLYTGPVAGWKVD